MKSAAIVPTWTERHEPRGQTPIAARGSLAELSLVSSNPRCSPLFSKATRPAMRPALDSPGGRDLTDAERKRADSRLLEFVRILREWDQKDQDTPAGNW